MMTPYWEEWKTIVFKAKEGNSLALVALYNLVDTLRGHDHGTPLDLRERGRYIQDWLVQQDFLHKSVMLVTCGHTFFPAEDDPDVLLCAFCGNRIHKLIVAQWKAEGWIQEA